MKYLALLLLSSTCLASGPKYRFQDAKLDDEIRNIYFDLRSIVSGSYPVMTKVSISALTPAKAGLSIYCSDCTTDAVCVSTGTTRGGFSRLTARTTSCQ